MAAAEDTVIDGELMRADAGQIADADSQALAPLKAEESKAEEPVIYDADAEQQRVSFRTERKGRLYIVHHFFGPIKDDAVLEYERQRSQKLSDAEADESDEQDATAVTSKGYQAALNYWNRWGARAEGYSGKVSDRDKVYAVNLLFGVEFEQLPFARADEPCPDDDDENSTYILRCLFDGRECYPSATMRPATNNEIEEFESLQSRALLVQGTRFGQRDQRIPAKAKRLAELFDSMKVSAENYKRRVPLHHKAAYALRHLRTAHEAVTGN